MTREEAINFADKVIGVQLVAAYELVLWFEGATSVPTSEPKESR